MYFRSFIGRARTGGWIKNCFRASNASRYFSSCYSQQWCTSSFSIAVKWSSIFAKYSINLLYTPAAPMNYFDCFFVAGNVASRSASVTSVSIPIVPGITTIPRYSTLGLNNEHFSCSGLSLLRWAGTKLCLCGLCGPYLNPRRRSFRWGILGTIGTVPFWAKYPMNFGTSSAPFVGLKAFNCTGTLLCVLWTRYCHGPLLHKGFFNTHYFSRRS